MPVANKPKAIGTRFESEIVKYLREELQDERIERRVLHGNRDFGDIYGLYAHGYKGIIEAKNHKAWNQPKKLAVWRDQTLAERGNADADFALLVVHVPQRGTAESMTHMTLRDLAKVAKLSGLTVTDTGGCELDPDRFWVQMTLAECCKLIKGVDDID